jgi:hypothetical protein
MFCQLVGGVAPTAVTQPPVPVDRDLAQLIGQRTELVNVRRQDLYHEHPGVRHRAISPFLRKHEGQ